MYALDNIKNVLATSASNDCLIGWKKKTLFHKKEDW